MATRKAPKKPEEIRVWFEYQLKLKGSNFAKIGRALGISRQAVQKSVHSPSVRLAEVISEVLKEDKKKLWPDRFAA